MSTTEYKDVQDARARHQQRVAEIQTSGKWLEIPAREAASMQTDIGTLLREIDRLTAPPKDAEHFRHIVAGYGEVSSLNYMEEPCDSLYIKEWGTHVRVRREPGATAPNWYGLCIAAQYYGYGFSAGIERGKWEAWRDLREMIGAKSAD